MRILPLVWDNLRRNPARTLLTALGTMVMVLVVTLVFTVLSTLDEATRDKESNFKVIVTEKWQIPSQMPYTYAAGLREGAAIEPGDVRPSDSMTWGFFAGTIDADNKTFDFNNTLFAFVMEPEKLLTMMDDLDEKSLSQQDFQNLSASVDKLKENRQGLIVGKKVLEKLNKRVGDRINLYGLNYKDIALELDIVGMFPEAAARYVQSSAINREYFNAALDAYQRTNGKPHPMADKSLNLVWLKLPSRREFAPIVEQITTSPFFKSPAVKCETASAGVGAFLEAYRDLFWGVRWLLTPACIVTLALVISNAISISVRERQTEFAVMKVLGFTPPMILMLVMVEAVTLGGLAGLLSSGLTYLLINGFGGLPFQVAFFPNFLVPIDAFWWGPVMGGGTALAGSLIPAWNARSVRVADVFARVT